MRCIGALLQGTGFLPGMADSKIATLRNYSDQLCTAYHNYKLCASVELQVNCYDIGRASQFLYSYVCDPEVRKRLQPLKACIKHVDQDPSVIFCEMTIKKKLEKLYAMHQEHDQTKANFLCDMINTYDKCASTAYLSKCGSRAWEIKLEFTRRSLPLYPGMDCSAVKAAPAKANLTLTKPVISSTDVLDNNLDLNLVEERKTAMPPVRTVTNQAVGDGACDASDNQCSQRCVNVGQSSYRCYCDQRYFDLADDGHTCVSKNKAKAWIVFAHGQTIWNTSTDGNTFELMRSGIQKCTMLDFDLEEKFLYYVDVGGDKIERVNFEGPFPKAVQEFDLEGTEGIAIDWVGRKIYTVQRSNMLVQELDGVYRKTLYKDVFVLPRAIAVHPLIGYVYATDLGSSAFIAKAAMDGSTFRRIVTADLRRPNALAIDYFADRLYWADAVLHRIESSDLDGRHRRMTLADPAVVKRPFGIALLNDDVYWTDWADNRIMRCHKKTGANATMITDTALLPYDLKMCHAAAQPEGENPCGWNNGHCFQLCLLAPATAPNGPQLNVTCACADGYIINKDHRSCREDCNENQIACHEPAVKCISKVYWCDGISHCLEGEDEDDCPERKCKPKQFQCHVDGGGCIERAQVCNGKVECSDGSDEKYC